MQQGKGPKTVVVLGVSRSGTSVAAGVLSILGVDMGFVGDSTKTNPKGAFEDKDFQRLNREIFKSVRGEEAFWDPPTFGEIMARQTESAPKIQTLVSKKSKDKSLWGWKDGRTALTLGLYLPYLTNPHLVTVSRNPLGTAKSIVSYVAFRKGKIEFFQALKLVDFYTGEMLAFLERHPDLPNLFVSFEDLIAEPRKEAEKLAAFLGIDLTAAMIEEIDAFIIPRDRIEMAREAARKKAPKGLMRKLQSLLGSGS